MCAIHKDALRAKRGHMCIWSESENQKLKPTQVLLRTFMNEKNLTAHFCPLNENLCFGRSSVEIVFQSDKSRILVSGLDPEIRSSARKAKSQFAPKPAEVLLRNSMNLTAHFRCWSGTVLQTRVLSCVSERQILQDTLYSIENVSVATERDLLEFTSLDRDSIRAVLHFFRA